MPAVKKSYRSRLKQNSLKLFLSQCPLLKRGPLKWSPFQYCLVNINFLSQKHFKNYFQNVFITSNGILKWLRQSKTLPYPGGKNKSFRWLAINVTSLDYIHTGHRSIDVSIRKVFVSIAENYKLSKFFTIWLQ